jgi:chemotaxis-related protein WspD
VAGDGSCPKLEQHIHCRNCEVYEGAARSSLQRPVDQAYRDHWAARLRQPAALADTRDQSGLVFRIGAEWLMLPTAMVRSVAPLAPSHRLPHRASAGLAGIVNVGGTVLPAISLGAMLGIDSDGVERAAGAGAGAGRHIFARLVVICWHHQSFALPVADLHGIVRYASGSMQAPAATINRGVQRYLAGVLSHAELHIGVLDAALIGDQLTRLLR